MLGSLVAGEDAAASLAASDKFGNTFSLDGFLQVGVLPNWQHGHILLCPCGVQVSALLGGM